MRAGKIFLGLLVGVAAGACMGLLLAPEKGTKTRKKIFSKGEDYADDFKKSFDKFCGDFTEIIENTRGSISKGKTKYAETRKA